MQAVKAPLEGTLAVAVTKDGDVPVLTAVPSGITTPGVKYRFQWYRNGKPITGATSASYSLKNSKNRNKNINVVVTATKPGFLKSTVSSVPKPYTITSDTGAPTISGNLGLARRSLSTP